MGHRSQVIGGGGVQGAVAHDVGAHSGLRYLRADIDGAWHPLQRVEVLAERFPLPRDPLRQRAAGNVLYALHQFDEPVVPVGPHRSETDAAIAHDRGGDAMPARRRQMRIPGGLTVEMRVDVDESWRDGEAVSVDGPPGRAANPADLGDQSVLHGDVCGARCRS